MKNMMLLLNERLRSMSGWAIGSALLLSGFAAIIADDFLPYVYFFTNPFFLLFSLFVPMIIYWLSTKGNSIERVCLLPLTSWQIIIVEWLACFVLYLLLLGILASQLFWLFNERELFLIDMMWAPLLLTLFLVTLTVSMRLVRSIALSFILFALAGGAIFAIVQALRSYFFVDEWITSLFIMVFVLNGALLSIARWRMHRLKGEGL